MAVQITLIIIWRSGEQHRTSLFRQVMLLSRWVLQQHIEMQHTFGHNQSANKDMKIDF